MTKSELFEEIRNLLREPQINTVSQPWLYTDQELTLQVRSAIRHLSVLGVQSFTAVMTTDGALTSEPTAEQGLLIALYVVQRLLVGDLTNKLLQGDLGIYFRAGSDIIDSKTAAGEFQKAATGYKAEYERLLTMVLSDAIDVANSVFGDPDVTAGDNE